MGGVGGAAICRLKILASRHTHKGQMSSGATTSFFSEGKLLSINRAQQLQTSMQSDSRQDVAKHHSVQSVPFSKIAKNLA